MNNGGIMVDNELVQVLKATIIDIVVRQQKLADSVKNLNTQKKEALNNYMQSDKQSDAKIIADIESEKESRKSDIKQLKEDLKVNVQELIKQTAPQE